MTERGGDEMEAWWGWTSGQADQKWNAAMSDPAVAKDVLSHAGM